MPHIQVEIGMATKEQKEKLIQALTKSASEVLGVNESSFKAILIDFLESGKSDGVEGFQWTYGKKANQTIALLEHLRCVKINLVGTS